MTNKYKYGSVSLPIRYMETLQQLSGSISDHKLSNATLVKMGINSLIENLAPDTTEGVNNDGSISDNKKSK